MSECGRIDWSGMSRQRPQSGPRVSFVCVLWVETQELRCVLIALVVGMSSELADGNNSSNVVLQRSHGAIPRNDSPWSVIFCHRSLVIGWS